VNAALKPLSSKQLAFVDAYLKNGRNATKAAIEAGYAARSVYNQGTRLMRNDEVKAEIARRIDAYTRTAGIQVVDLLLEMKSIAFSDLRELFDDDGKPLDPSMWPAETAKFVAAFGVAGKRDVGPDGEPIRLTWKIRLHDKQKALSALLDFLLLLNQPGQSAGGDAAAKGQIDATKAVADLRAVLDDAPAKSANASDVVAA
jgi:phage terminase small subunit